MIIYKCDRCKKEVDELWRLAELPVVIYEASICENCLGDLRELVVKWMEMS